MEEFTKVKLSELIDFESLEYEWEKIESIPEFAKLKECKQNPKWHGEGDAFAHTKKVCEAMQKLLVDEYCFHPLTCLAAALFHDIGKGQTTFFKEKDQNWHAYGHEVVGERMVREMLADENPYFVDAIARLTRWHMEPLNIKKSKHKIQKMFRLAKDVTITGSGIYEEVYHFCTFRDLLLLKETDVLGSEQEDKVGWKEDMGFIHMLRDVADESGILDGWNYVFDYLLD